MKVIVIGQDLLGKEIVKLSSWDFINRDTHTFDYHDVTSVFKYLNDYDIIINCVSHTDVDTDERESHWAINYKAVTRLTDYCSENNKKLVQISTDYVYANSTGLPTETNVPVHAENWYSYTKLLAEGYVELKSKDYLIIRCGFKEFPYTAQHAWSDVKGNFDYVSNIAEGIIRLVASQREGIYNVGSSDSHTLHDLAKESFPEVNETLSNETTPKDVSMNCMKYKIAITDE